MAKNVFYDCVKIIDEETDTAEEIYKQLDIKLEELSVSERKEKLSKCESCVSKFLYEGVAVFLCFVCEMYVCVKCLSEHESHAGMKVWINESERQKDRDGEQSEIKKKKKQGLLKKILAIEKKAENERKKEKEENVRKRKQHEKDGMRENFVDKLMNESKIDRRKELKNSHVSICDRVEVKHELNQEDCCWITGLCGLKNRRWVVCDRFDSSIKIFKLGSHALQRYIRFVGHYSRPYDVTEIDLKQNSTEPNFVSGSRSDISAADWADPNKQCLIAVTLPWEYQIVFLDLSEKPAKAQKLIKTEEECYTIQFYDEKIFTVCKEDRDFRYSVYIKSTDGDTLNKFDIGIRRHTDPYLAVVSGRVYLTDLDNNKVQCRNVEGEVISEIIIKGSWSEGISVDRGNNVYVCAFSHNKVYKLDADLTRYKSVLDRPADCIEEPWALCYYRDKLFISHGWSPSLRNFVTVVRLL